MDRKEQEKQLVESLLAEAKSAHERIGAYTDATQRFLSIMFPVVTGTIGYLFSQTKKGKFAELLSGEMLPYELMVLSIIISLALALTTHYNTLAFFYIERKNLTGRRLQRAVGLTGNPLNAASDLRNSGLWLPFIWSSRTYYYCEAFSGLGFAIAAISLKAYQGSNAWLVFWFVEGPVLLFALAACTSTAIFLTRAQRTFRLAKPLDQSPETQANEDVQLEFLPLLWPAEPDVPGPGSSIGQ